MFARPLALTALPALAAMAALALPATTQVGFARDTGASTVSRFAPEDLPVLLREPPRSLGVLEGGKVSTSSRVRNVFDDYDRLSRELLANWRRSLLEAGFRRVGEVVFTPAGDGFSLAIEIVLFRSAGGARVGLRALRDMHLDYLANSLVVSRTVAAGSLGRRAWGTHSKGSVDVVTAFGLIVGNAAFQVTTWSSVDRAPPSVDSVRAAALELAARAHRLLKTTA